MAKSDFDNKQELQEFINGLQKVKAEYNALNKLAKELASSPGKAQQEVRKQIKALNEQYESYKSILNSIKNAEKELDTFNKTQKKIVNESKKIAESFEDMVDSFGELEGLQHSISSQFGKSHVQTKAMQAVVEKTKAEYNGIKSILNSTSDIQQHQKDSIDSALEIYKNFPVTISDLNKQLKRGKIEQEGVNAAIIDTVNEYSDFIGQLDTSNDTIAIIKSRLEDLLPVMAKFQSAAEASKKEFENIDAAAAAVNFGIGGVAGGAQLTSAGADITKNMLSGTDLKTMTMVGAAIGAIELQAQLSGKALAIARADNAVEEQKLKNKLLQRELQLNVANGLYERKALIDFKYELEGLTKEFNAASKTAFFGSGLPGLDYNVAQLQLAGVSVEQINQAINDLAMSGNTVAELGDNVALFARKTGVGTSELASMIGLFRALDRTKGTTAFGDVTRQMDKMFAQGYNPADIANELKSASQIAYEFNIKNSQELVKQVKSARDMGMSFDKIAQAGKNMVLNYKDSIKKEMELSALLGESVDLSVVRALANTDPTSAFKLLKESGLYEKAKQFGFTGTTLLGEAAGGIDMEQLAAPNLEKTPGRMPSNQEFLNKLTEAQKNLVIDKAFIEIKKEAAMSMFELAQTEIMRKDKGAIGIAGEMIRQDAQNFLKEQYAKIIASGEIAPEMYEKMRENMPFGIGNLMPEWENGPLMYLSKQAGIFDEDTGKDYLKNPKQFKPIDYLPGITNKTSTQAGIDNLMPGGQKYDFTKSNQINEAIKTQQKNQEKVANNSNLQTTALTGAATSLNSINTQTILQTQLLQNIQALTAATSNLANVGLGDMKLLLDGKEVKNRIERVYVQEKGKTRN